MKPAKESNSSQQSDSETIEQTSCSYDHLINEIKMKSTALLKASNLIEILQIEVSMVAYRQLQVEKNSKQQAILEAQENIRRSYQAEITALQEQIISLEQRKTIPIVHSTQLRGSPKEVINRQNFKTSSGKDTHISNRSRSKSNCNIEKRKKSQLQLAIANQNCFEAKMYRNIILEMTTCNYQMINFMQDFNQVEKKELQEVVDRFEDQSRFVMDWMDEGFEFDDLKNASLEKKIKQLEKIIASQCDLISDMKTYQTNLEQFIKGIAVKLTHLFAEKVYSPKIDYEEISQNYQHILKIVNCFKLSSDQKYKKIENQNTQLRGVIEEMIELMRKKKNND